MAALSSLSLSGLTELSSASELRLGQCSTQRTPFHIASPTVAKETQPITLEYQWHGHPPFCAPQGLWLSSSAEWSCSLCYLVTQMEVFNFKSTDLSEQLPLCRLSWQSAKAEVRCVVLFTAKMAAYSAALLFFTSLRDLLIVLLNMELSNNPVMQNFSMFCVNLCRWHTQKKYRWPNMFQACSKCLSEKGNFFSLH